MEDFKNWLLLSSVLATSYRAMTIARCMAAFNLLHNGRRTMLLSRCYRWRKKHSKKLSSLPSHTKVAFWSWPVHSQTHVPSTWTSSSLKLVEDKAPLTSTTSFSLAQFPVKSPNEKTETQDTDAACVQNQWIAAQELLSSHSYSLHFPTIE